MLNVLYYFQGDIGESMETPNAFVIPLSSTITYKIFLDYFNKLGILLLLLFIVVIIIIKGMTQNITSYHFRFKVTYLIIFTIIM